MQATKGIGRLTDIRWLLPCFVNEVCDEPSGLLQLRGVSAFGKEIISQQNCGNIRAR